MLACLKIVSIWDIKSRPAPLRLDCDSEVSCAARDLPLRRLQLAVLQQTALCIFITSACFEFEYRREVCTVWWKCVLWQWTRDHFVRNSFVKFCEVVTASPRIWELSPASTHDKLLTSWLTAHLCGCHCVPDECTKSFCSKSCNVHCVRKNYERTRVLIFCMLMRQYLWWDAFLFWFHILSVPPKRKGK